MDPWFAKSDIVGVNRYSFLLESLRDLDNSLRKLGSRLYIVKGKPEEQIPLLVGEWGVDLVTFETDSEPYAIQRDAQIATALRKTGVRVSSHSSHTLNDLNQYVGVSKGNIPGTYQSFQKLFASLGTVRKCVGTPDLSMIPAAPKTDLNNHNYDIPSLADMGYTEPATTTFPGGETEALRRLVLTVTNRPGWVASFEKPNTSPNALSPSTTVLSPYLKFGCVSAAKFYHELSDIYKDQKTYTKPPVSLHGQLLWREFFYLCSFTTPNYDKMRGNPKCKQIPWERDEAKILAFKEGRTGYPYIDAIMTQLRVEGWIHHLARHSVACFLTRGDLWQHWEEGAKVFDLYLLDGDWALNNANWQWLSCSNFFFQYFRCYSPVAFGKKTDKDGAYIRKWIPALANFPDKYIYEPFKAPLNVQQKSGCVIGVDYPMPIVNHDDAVKENMAKMKQAYASQGGSSSSGGDDDSGGSSSSSSSSGGGGDAATPKKGKRKDDSTQKIDTMFAKKAKAK
jgi:cryptochrome